MGESFTEDRFETHLHLERYCNGKMDVFLDNLIKSGSVKMDMENKYRPSSDIESFDIPSYSVPKDLVKVMTADPDPALLAHFVNEHTVNFYVHPELVTDETIDYMKDVTSCPKSNHQGVATSSFRTIAIVDQTIGRNFCVKVHYPRKISSYYHKTLGPKTVWTSVQVSADLKLVKHPKFHFLPECIGISFPTIKGEKRGWGLIVRDMTPYPSLPETDYLIPFFAIYNVDNKIPGSPLLMKYLVECSGKSPFDYVLNDLIIPVMETWVAKVQYAAVLGADHGQNLLLAWPSGGIVSRDFDTFVDPKLRAKLGLTLDNLHPTNFVEEGLPDRPKGGFYSSVYDYIVGRLLNHLEKAYVELYGDCGDALANGCAKRFAEVMPEYKEYFTDDCYEWSTEFSGPNRHPIVKSNDRPKWRPRHE